MTVDSHRVSLRAIRGGSIPRPSGVYVVIDYPLPFEVGGRKPDLNRYLDAGASGEGEVVSPHFERPGRFQGCRWCKAEGVRSIGDAVIVIVIVCVVPDTVAVSVGALVRVGRKSIFSVPGPIAIDVAIRVVPDTVTVHVGALVGIEGEGIVPVIHAVTVVITVAGITHSVTVGVELFGVHDVLAVV